MDYETILTKKADGIATITLNRPDALNAFTRKMSEEMLQAIIDAGDDAEVRAVVLTGAGKHFSAGVDVQERFAEPIARKKRGEFNPALAPFFTARGIPAIMKLGKPIIAAVNGAAVGLGCTVSLACDIRIASDKARFGMPFARMGISPEFGSTWLLPRLIGTGKSLEILYTARLVEAAEAKEIGLVNQVVPADKLLEAAYELAKSIAAMPPLSIKMIREGIYRGAESDLQTAIRWEQFAFNTCLTTEDHEEGVKAFLEKRAPNFKGK